MALSRQTRHRGVMNALLKAFLVLLVVIEIYPVVWILLSSLKTQSEFLTQPSYTLPHSFQFKNYVDAWTYGNMGVYFGNTVLTTAGALLLTILVALPAGFCITMMTWKLQGAALSFIIAGMMVPVQATLIPIFLAYKAVGLTNTLLGLTLVYAATNIPLAIFLLSTYMKSIPRELLEAAVVDGCTVYGVFLRIIAPIAKNMVFSVMTLEFFYSWNDLLFSMTFNSKASLKTIQTGLLSFVGQFGQRQWGPTLASIAISVIPTAILYIVLNKMVITGMTAGAVKG